MKKSETRRNIAKEISFFTMGLADYAGTPGIGIGFNRKSLGNPFRKLKNILKKRICPYGLKIVKMPENADYIVVLFAEFDNHDGYDCLGLQCYSKSKRGKFPKVESISYCGLCGDVNTLRFTKANSKVMFLGTV